MRLDLIATAEENASTEARAWPDQATLLRPETTADRDFGERLFINLHRGPLEVAGWKADQCLDYLQREYARREREIEQHHAGASYYIIRHDAVDVGRLIVDRQFDRFTLLEMVLLPPWRNRGIGAECLRQLCRQADQARLSIELRVQLDNPAVRLYLGFEFEIVSSSGANLTMRRQPGAIPELHAAEA